MPVAAEMLSRSTSFTAVVSTAAAVNPGSSVDSDGQHGVEDFAPPGVHASGQRRQPRFQRLAGKRGDPYGQCPYHLSAASLPAAVRGVSGRGFMELPVRLCVIVVLLAGDTHCGS